MLESMEQLEKFIYEAKPYFYFGLAIYALAASEPKPWIVACALILLGCGAIIVRMRLKNRRGSSSLEQLVYDIQPFFYLAFAGYALIYLRNSKMATGFALLLLFCGSMILRWRLKNRR
jgi:drug/metabolite transporter (DMT)-like permease